MGRTEVFRRGGRRPGDEGLDDQLLSRIANGDEAAWPLIVDRHLAPIVSFAWYNLGDRAAAEDVAQECFVRLFRKVPDWQPGGAKLSTWLYRVATNLCIDRRRADRFEPLDLAQGRSGVAEIARELDMSLTLERALRSLTEKQRLAVVLVHYQGWSNIEAAGLLDTSVEALESLLARARRTLRRDLQPDLSELLGER